MSSEVTGNMYRPQPIRGIRVLLNPTSPKHGRVKALRLGGGGGGGPPLTAIHYHNTEGHIAGYLVSGRLDIGALPGSLSFELLNLVSLGYGDSSLFRGSKPPGGREVISSPGGSQGVGPVGSPYSRGCWHDVSPPRQLDRQGITPSSG